MLTVDEDKASIITWVWRTIKVLGTAVAEPSETCLIELQVLTECRRNFTVKKFVLEKQAYMITIQLVFIELHKMIQRVILHPYMVINEICTCTLRLNL